MDNSLVRICSIELNGFKSTKHGIIEMPSVLDCLYFSKKADILGIYGRNGSGKTAVVEAMEFIKMLLSGRSLPQRVVEYIDKEQESCSLYISFALEDQGIRSKVGYKVELRRISDDDFKIFQETLMFAKWNGTKFEKQKRLLSIKADAEIPYQSLVPRNKENRIELAVAKKMAQKEHRSFLFCHEGLGMFLSSQTGKESMEGENTGICRILKILFDYAHTSLFVFPDAFSESMSLNSTLLITFCINYGNNAIAKKQVSLKLEEPTTISNEDFQALEQSLKSMNTVLAAMIPGFSLDIHEFGPRLMEQGMEGRRVQPIARRGNLTIPLSCESGGILKIISILNVLIYAYNNASVCLIADELDAGIYEYLLGELLSAFQKNAKGQLIFTSHNLRPLEMINTSSIIFSTSNPEHRYTRMKSKKTPQNLRNLYLRSIILGGQEEIYGDTDTLALGRAFRRAGREIEGADRKGGGDDSRC